MFARQDSSPWSLQSREFAFSILPPDRGQEQHGHLTKHHLLNLPTLLLPWKICRKKSRKLISRKTSGLQGHVQLILILHHLSHLQQLYARLSHSLVLLPLSPSEDPRDC